MTRKKETSADEVLSQRVKKVAEQAQSELQESADTMLNMARKVLLAGVGAVALTKDEVEAFVARLVERGEIAEQDGRKLIQDVLSRQRESAEKVEEQVGERLEKIEAMLDARIERVLARLNVPSKADIDALSQKVAALTKKVEALKERQGK